MHDEQLRHPLIVENVLCRYIALGSGVRLHALGNRGGFSGAKLWRVDSSAGSFCLKAWPHKGMTCARLAWIHELMAKARSGGLSFVPTVLPVDYKTTLVTHEDYLWDLTEWMPGVADFHVHPTPARLRGACQALAQLHAVWKRCTSQVGQCPAVQRRLQAASLLSDWIKRGWSPCEEIQDVLVSKRIDRAWQLLRSRESWIERKLEHFKSRPMPLQPCLCDVWHDHIFFDGDNLTAIIDYGGLKIDHIAVDLARLLGSLVGNHLASQEIGLGVYARLIPLSDDDRQLIQVLDRTGTLAGLITWIRWLCHERRKFENATAVAKRISELTRRAEQWKG
jgi:thiamine kinase-like enzyme